MKEKGTPVAKEIYLLCRSDKHTKNRHVERNHKDVSLDNQHGHYDFIVPTNNNEAVQLRSAITQFNDDNPTSSQDSNTLGSAIENAQGSSSLSSKKTCDNKQVSRTLLQSKLFTDNQATLSIKLPSGKTSEETCSPIVEKLTNKIDSLTKSVEKISSYVEGKSRNSNDLGPMASLGTKNFEESLKVVNEWATVENIAQLLNRFPNLCFFVGNSCEQLPVLRCEVCYMYLVREPYTQQQDSNEALKTARKGIGK